MIYSEGLVNQHLAYATSRDLHTWEDGGRLQLDGGRLQPAAPQGHSTQAAVATADGRATQAWMAGRFGAPHVWRDGADGCFRMVLMGEYETATHRSAVGLLSSADGEQWELLPEKRGPLVNLNISHERKSHLI